MPKEGQGSTVAAGRPGKGTGNTGAPLYFQGSGQRGRGAPGTLRELSLSGPSRLSAATASAARRGFHGFPWQRVRGGARRFRYRSAREGGDGPGPVPGAPLLLPPPRAR